MKKLLSILLLSMALLFSSCSSSNGGENSVKPPEKQGEKAPVQKPANEKKEITLVAIGDIMFHQSQLRYASTGKGYNFRPQFEGIKSEIESADIALGNFETTINPALKITGYPVFNSPVDVLDGVKYAGFDVLSTANNHSMDTGSKGIISTVESIRKYGMIPVGTGRVSEDKFAVVEKNGIKVGILSYTFGTNGLKAPDGMINLIDMDKIKSDVTKIKSMSDFVVVFLHHGTEYGRKVEAEQEKLFKDIADLGADSVIGSHPHVARKSEVYETGGRKVFIAYSLGNFISNQNDKYTDIGLMVKLKISKTDKAQIEDADIMPVYRLRYKEGGKTVYNVVPYDKIDKYSRITKDQKNYVTSVFNELGGESSVEVFKNK